MKFKPGAETNSYETRNSMPEYIEKSRMEELEETVKDLSQKVETLSNENAILSDKSTKCNTWVAQLLLCCKEMVKHVDALEKKCSALTQELDLQNLHLETLSMTLSVEEKSLNNDSFSEMLQIQAPPISEIPELTMDEFPPTMDGLTAAMDEFPPIMDGFAAGMDEFNAAMEGAPQSEPEHQSFPSYSMNTNLEPIAVIPANRKRKAQEITESGPGTLSQPSSSCSSQIIFLNTFSDEVPRKRPTRNLVRRAGRPKSVMPLTLPPEESAQGQLVQGAQNRKQELWVTEGGHGEAINVPSVTSDYGYSDLEYELFKTSNWVY